jgi:hypothetical protein
VVPDALSKDDYFHLMTGAKQRLQFVEDAFMLIAPDLKRAGIDLPRAQRAKWDGLVARLATFASLEPPPENTLFVTGEYER